MSKEHYSIDLPSSAVKGKSCDPSRLLVNSSVDFEKLVLHGSSKGKKKHLKREEVEEVEEDGKDYREVVDVLVISEVVGNWEIQVPSVYRPHHCCSSSFERLPNSSAIRTLSSSLPRSSSSPLSRRPLYSGCTCTTQRTSSSSRTLGSV